MKLQIVYRCFEEINNMFIFFLKELGKEERLMVPAVNLIPSIAGVTNVFSREQA